MSLALSGPWSRRVSACPSHFDLGDVLLFYPLWKEYTLTDQLEWPDVDYLHETAHPRLSTTAIHGTLSRAVCTSCNFHLDRNVLQEQLKSLNPAWLPLLDEVVEATVHSNQQLRIKSGRTFDMNPDGDIELHGMGYETFEYPPCPRCAVDPPAGRAVVVRSNGALDSRSTAGFLQPGVVMFGQDLPVDVREKATQLIDRATRLVVVGSSLATQSALRLVRLAQSRNLPLGIINIGGVRDEASIIPVLTDSNDGAQFFRCDFDAADVLEGVVDVCRK